MSLFEIDSVTVDGIPYEIQWIDPSTQYTNVGCVAEIDKVNCKIRVSKYNERYALQALIHEIIHIIDDNRLGNAMSEMQVNTVSVSIAAILWDNPDLALQFATAGIEFEPEDDEESDADCPEE